MEYDKRMRPFVKANQELVQLNVAVMGEADNRAVTFLKEQLFRFLPMKCVAWIKEYGTKSTAKAANSMTSV